MLAPLWTDNDALSGDVYYHIYDLMKPGSTYTDEARVKVCERTKTFIFYIVTLGDKCIHIRFMCILNLEYFMCILNLMFYVGYFMKTLISICLMRYAIIRYHKYSSCCCCSSYVINYHLQLAGDVVALELVSLTGYSFTHGVRYLNSPRQRHYVEGTNSFYCLFRKTGKVV